MARQPGGEEEPVLVELGHEEALLGGEDLEHTQFWAHRPRRLRGESPPGLMEPPKQAPLSRVGLGS